MRGLFHEIGDLWVGDHHPISLFFCIDKELANGIRKINYIDQTKGFTPKTGYAFGFQGSYFLYAHLKSARSDLTKLREMTSEKAH